jgi:hypothetical protein
MDVKLCRLCNEEETPGRMADLCDSCWELERRIENDFEIAKKIVAEIEEKRLLKGGRDA